MSKKTKLGTELQSITRLIKDGSLGLTDVIEAMHRGIINPPFIPETPIQNIANSLSNFTYYSIRQSTKIIGDGIEKVLGQLTPFMGDVKTKNEGEVIRSVLNGVFGDYLEDQNNSLQIKMHFRNKHKAIDLNEVSLKEAFPIINGKILILVHGSCLNHSQWSRKEHNHGEQVEKEHNKTLIYLNYNSGSHISTNGQKYNELLEELVLNWPVPVTEIVMISHSMGGLVTRSAIYYGEQQTKKWTKHLKKIVFLGTPHHGSSLERTGNYIDGILKKIHYTRPLTQLSKVRSAGVTDLRYGNLIDRDWKDNNRFEKNEDLRLHIPLPKEAEAYAIAASTSKITGPLSFHLLGDGLVDIKSAFGQHKNPGKDLNFKLENTHTAYENSHMDLLSEPGVYSKINEWIEQ